MILAMLRPAYLALALSSLVSLALVACGDSDTSSGGTGGQVEISTSTGPLACDDEPCSPSQRCVDCGGGENSFQCELIEADEGFFLCGTQACLNDLDACVARPTATSCMDYTCDARSACAGDPCSCIPAGCNDCQVDGLGQLRYVCPPL